MNMEINESRRDDQSLSFEFSSALPEFYSAPHQHASITKKNIHQPIDPGRRINHMTTANQKTLSVTLIQADLPNDKKSEKCRKKKRFPSSSLDPLRASVPLW